MPELTPERVIEVVERRAAQMGGPLLAFWLPIEGDRSEYQAALRAARKTIGVAPLVVRGGFSNPNALHSDLAEIIAANRDEIEVLQGPFTSARPLAIVLLARVDLGFAQVASPAVLPPWVPGIGGQTTEIVIENLNATATAPLNAPETRISEIAQELFELEGIFLGRLEMVRQADHRRGNAFFELIRAHATPNTRLGEYLDAAIAHRASVLNASAFRPSSSDGPSLTGRLMRIASEHSPDQLYGAGSSLANALAIDALPDDFKDAIPTVLLRSTIPNENPAARVGRNILVTVFAASQLVTAAAHADEYAEYLVVLLQSISYNLRETLRDISAHLVGLPALPPREIPADYDRRSQ